MNELDVFYKDGIPSDEYKVKTLCYVFRTNDQGEREILLGKHYKQGKWNGFGGKVGDKSEFKDESVEEAVIREGREEFGIAVEDPHKRGMILFVFCDELGKEHKVLGHVFFADKYSGEVVASEEMATPTWFVVEAIPWSEMWPNDRVWLEELISRDEFLEAEFKFGTNNELVASESKMQWIP